MSTTLAQHFKDYFSHQQPEIIHEEEILDEIVFKSPFVTSDEIFADVLPSVESNEFYSMSYIGTQGFGKSTSAAELATNAEDAGFLVVYGKADEILPDLLAWIAEVKKKIKAHDNSKVCFVIDDMSYATGTISVKAAAKFKHFIGDIRHVFEERNEKGEIIFKPKIFMIYISHRYHSLPPILRNSSTWLFVSAQPEDKSDAMKIIPRLKEERDKLEVICSFLQTVTTDGPRSKDGIKFMSGKNEFIFRWGDRDDPGDGRLLMLVHKGVLKLYNAKKKEFDLDLEDYRVKIPLPPPPDPDEEVKKKELLKKAIKKKAEELFPIETEFEVNEIETGS